MARARAAAAGDFPALFGEIDNIFPKDTNPDSRHAALTWLMGLWIVQDAAAAAAYIEGRKDDESGTTFGRVLAGMAPEKVAGFLNGPHGPAMGRYFTAAVTHTLAKTNPREYLRVIEKPGKSASRYWPEALGALAVESPEEAAALWTERSTSNGAQKALSTVLSAWVQRDAQAARAWVERVEDPKMQHLARHAWLTELARHDLPAARRALANFEAGEWIPGKQARDSSSEYQITDARMEIAILGARSDLASALKDLSAIAAQMKAASTAPGEAPQGMDGRRETQSAIIEAALSALPKEPAALFAVLQNMKTAAGPEVDAALMREVESSLLTRTFTGCSAETSLEAARLLAARPASEQHTGVMQLLVGGAAHRDPRGAVEFLATLPEAQRGEVASTLLPRMQTSDPALIARVANAIPADAWTNDCGLKLAESPAQNAVLVAGLPVNDSTGAVRARFGGSWMASDPEAASRWISSLSPNRGSAQTARAATVAWARYDDVSASAWAATLPQGQTRDGAALGLAASLAGTDPEAAWKWAASIADREYAVVAYANAAHGLGKNAPPEFLTAWTAALDAAGLQGQRRTDALSELNKLPSAR